jgi:hypothetical protein
MVPWMPRGFAPCAHTGARGAKSSPKWGSARGRRNGRFLACPKTSMGPRVSGLRERPFNHLRAEMYKGYWAAVQRDGDVEVLTL